MTYSIQWTNKIHENWAAHFFLLIDPSTGVGIHHDPSISGQKGGEWEQALFLLKALQRETLGFHGRILFPTIRVLEFCVRKH